ncbi:mucosal pentraxin-like isoform X3 [Stegostoma tigrinum]|uniref:mucosal pentraxin-like isoform X3 n=1 Tax=Stegostoma tigrinum TaxID=3053191 RepID=UPI00202B8FCB|nr:mucosal pentraxin-like isoform X3 [Stegostoma tigrinum]XP_048379949.1 mucosal pentraxin-like isoform X3 [Stegostoma tigrinum]XP_048379950.1 mucosal pentraxin-like isoform X3 [Stegostoma tigrinum]
MKNVILLGLINCIFLVGLVHGDLSGKSLVFSSQTDSIYVKLLPAEFSHLSAFTLCLRAASEAKRGYSLLSYATASTDNELLLWHNENTKLSLYFGSDIFHFALPETDALLRHICVSWDSPTGIITFWFNGVRSLRKVGNKGGIVRSGGTFILGQEQDQVGGKFDSKQSFVGELTDVHLWDHVLSANSIKALSQGCHSAGGNIISWHTVQYESVGNVKIEANHDCSF